MVKELDARWLTLLTVIAAGSVLAVLLGSGLPTAPDINAEQVPEVQPAEMQLLLPEGTTADVNAINRMIEGFSKTYSIPKKDIIKAFNENWDAYFGEEKSPETILRESFGMANCREPLVKAGQGFKGGSYAGFTGREAYEAYGFDRLLFSWKKEKISTGTCASKEYGGDGYFCDSTQMLLMASKWFQTVKEKLPEALKTAKSRQPDVFAFFSEGKESFELKDMHSKRLALDRKRIIFSWAKKAFWKRLLMRTMQTVPLQRLTLS